MTAPSGTGRDPPPGRAEELHLSRWKREAKGGPTWGRRSEQGRVTGTGESICEGLGAKQLTWSLQEMTVL